MSCENFEDDLRGHASRTKGVLVYIEIDGGETVDVDLGKRLLKVAFVETGDLHRAKELRKLIHAWVEEDKLLEKLHTAPPGATVPPRSTKQPQKAREL